MSFATVALAALALVAPAAARPSRTRSTPPPPPSTTIDTGSFNTHTTSTSTSTASCNAEVKAATWSSAKSAFVDLIAAVTKDFCFVSEQWGSNDYVVDVDHKQQDGQIEAIANLVLESKLECTTTGKYALACASSWAGAYSFAAAGVELYSSAWADGTNELSHCKCAVDVFAKADALTSSWAEIWVSIYKALDDSVCAQSFDGNPDSVKSHININCVGNLVLKYFVKAIAKVIVDKQCEPAEYLACKACCKDPVGTYIDGCKLEECETQCHKDEYASLTATAYAAINFEEESSFSCLKNHSIDYVTYWDSYVPLEHYKHVYGAEDTYASCEAYAEADAWASAASGQAEMTKRIFDNVCDPLPWKERNSDGTKTSVGTAAFDKTADDWARAYVKVLVSAHTNCSASGGDAAYDGGCARAVSFSKAYAEACSEAFAQSLIDVKYGVKQRCQCDVSARVVAEATAHELAIITAFYQTEVEARSCNPDILGTVGASSITQQCEAEVLADMIARAMASVSLEGGCAPSGDNKLEYCETQVCREYETHEEDWEVCLTECTKDTELAVKAALSATATINIDYKERCTDFDGQEGQKFGDTYLTILNGYANSTQTGYATSTQTASRK